MKIFENVVRLFKKSMSESKVTIREILDKLNGKNKHEPWEVVDNIYAVRQVNIDREKRINNTGNGIVLKMFANNKTGEMRLYFAKDTDDSEARKLL